MPDAEGKEKVGPEIQVSHAAFYLIAQPRRFRVLNNIIKLHDALSPWSGKAPYPSQHPVLLYFPVMHSRLVPQLHTDVGDCLTSTSLAFAAGPSNDRLWML